MQIAEPNLKQTEILKRLGEDWKKLAEDKKKVRVMFVLSFEV